MSEIISIVDYGMGNLHSVANALRRLGSDSTFVTKPEEVLRANRLILPGVGAFAACMKSLTDSGLVDALRSRVLGDGVPLLGICVGMQLLATEGQEFGRCEGLGWIPGLVKRFDIDCALPVPHMGWNEIYSNPAAPWGNLLDSHMYFVHSYHMVCEHVENVVATSHYGTDFVAAIVKQNILGTQFHPEKSGMAGLHVLDSFIKWMPQNQ